jgi:phosphoribosylanthranilate isomerase
VSLYVKICGLTDEAAVAAAVEAGADAIGFVFAASPRRVTPARAAELARAVPATVEVIAVCRHPQQSLVEEIAAVLHPARLQTDAADYARLTLPASLGRLPVLRSGSAIPDPLPARFLYEGVHSGTGTTADWDEAARLARHGGLLLAGGLRPANVVAALRAVRPAGVDVSSGVERAPGIKDPDLIREFVSNARAEARILSGVAT